MSLVDLLYDPLIFALSLFVAPFFALHRRGRKLLAQRYGHWNLEADTLVSKNFIWFHGASVGEVNGLIPIMQEWRKRFPQYPILLTATSTSGLERAKHCSDFQRLLPFDCSTWYRRALGNRTPRALIFSETEIWPGLLTYLSRTQTPIYMINARISDYSVLTYKLLAPLLATPLRSITRILASTPRNADRFFALGIDQSRIEVVGNSKYDLKPSVKSADDARAMHQHLFGSDESPVLVLASLRPGEEKPWLEALTRFYKNNSGLKVIIAPRHQEKFEYFEQQLKNSGLPFRRWSELDNQDLAMPQDKPIVFLNAMGVLESTFSYADAAFIGGSLEDFGGHNPLEAAAYGACVLIGPHHNNVREIVQAMQASEACIEISYDYDFLSFLLSLAERDVHLDEIGLRGQQIWTQYTGATERICALCFDRVPETEAGNAQV